MRPPTPCYAFFSTVRKYCTINYNARKPMNVNVSKVTWNDKQLEIIEAVKRGKSVFITGSAGTGKTMLIEHLIELLRPNPALWVGLAEADAKTLVSTVIGNNRACNRWKQAKALVIDEISMLDKNVFNKFEYIGKKVRCESGNDDKPWGGIQLVVCGDFFQLPPRNAKFAFEADCWELSFQLFVQLETVYRQSNSDHVKLLEGIRVGEIDGKTLELLQQRCCKEEPDEAVIRLFPMIKDVDRVNGARLTSLGEEIIVYKAHDFIDFGRQKRQVKNVLAPSELKICKGARVMLIRNWNVKHELENGAIGTVVGFEKSRLDDVKDICCQDGNKVLPIVKFDSGQEEVIGPDKWQVIEGDKLVARRLQLPLMLAWATSIRKSQGMTLDKLHIDLSEAFKCGMVYVALSRLKSLDGLPLSGFDPSKVKAHPKVLEYYMKHFSTVRKFYTINRNASKPKNVNVSKVTWNNKQLEIIEAVKCGKSVFITGSAGTGKTMLIEHLIELLVKNHGMKTVYVTAPTGVAACALRGQTLHSFAGAGIARADAETLLSKVIGNKRAFNRWKQAKALVIDEISMVGKVLLDKYEYIARKVRCKSGNDEKPWGGIQLVVSGDFFQLPPINTTKFAFEADCWEFSFQLFVQLETVFRQSNSEHVKLLEGIRIGEIDEKGLELLQQRCCEEEPDEAVVRLFPNNKDVDRVNTARLTSLGEEIIVYKARDFKASRRRKHHLNKVLALSKLEICKGAGVMLIRNLNVKHELENGAIGTVVGFEKSRLHDIKKICCRKGDKVLPIVKFDSGQEEVIGPDQWQVIEGDKLVARRLQLPLMLAWATSIRKSQGMTLDKLHIDLSKAFGCGMVYVALSRLKSLDGLLLTGFDPSKIKAHPKVLEYYKKHFRRVIDS